MPAPDLPVASVLITALAVDLRMGDEPVPFYEVSGRGIVVPGVVIPGEWWDRPRLIDRLVVTDGPTPDARERLVVGFRGRCDGPAGEALRAIVDGDSRDEIEREVVPPLLEALALALDRPRRGLRVLSPRPALGTPVDPEPAPPRWGPSPLAGGLAAWKQSAAARAFLEAFVAPPAARAEAPAAPAPRAAVVAEPAGPAPVRTRTRVRVVDT
jgi:hypothetical protein